MLDRLKTAIPLILIVVLALFLPKPWGSLFFLLLSAGMLYFGIEEAFSMTGMKDDCRADKWLTVAFSFAYAASASNLSSLDFGPLILVCYFLALCLLLLRRTPEHIHRLFTSLGIFFYITWTLSFFLKIYALPGGQKLVFYVIAVTKMCDVGAYIVGTLTAKGPKGNHKLAPSFSPKKSWEGLLGGILFGIATSLLLLKCGTHPRFGGMAPIGCLCAILFGVLAAVIGLVGDLVESAMKRTAGLKDSGHLPGIGGVLDVLDSLIPIAPIFYALFRLTWQLSL